MEEMGFLTGLSAVDEEHPKPTLSTQFPPRPDKKWQIRGHDKQIPKTYFQILLGK